MSSYSHSSQFLSNKLLFRSDESWRLFSCSCVPGYTGNESYPFLTSQFDILFYSKLYYKKKKRDQPGTQEHKKRPLKRSDRKIHFKLKNQDGCKYNDETTSTQTSSQLQMETCNSLSRTLYYIRRCLFYFNKLHLYS